VNLRWLLLATIATSACVVDGTEREEHLGRTSSALTVDQEIAKASCSTSSAVVQGLSDQILEEMSKCLKPGFLVKVPSGAGLANSSVHAYLEKPAADALAAAIKARPGDTISVSSMFRTVAQQYFLWRRSSCYAAVASPGTSNHETGLAMDVSDPDNSTWRATLESKGFKWLGSFDHVHFDYVGAGAVNLKGTDVLAFQRLWNRNNPTDKIAEDSGWGPETEARLRKSPATGFAIGAVCAPPPATGPWPKLEVEGTSEGVDRFSDGPSAAVVDVLEGDEYFVNLAVKNVGDAPAKDVTLGVWVEQPSVLAVHWDIESDWLTTPAGTFKISDVNDRTDNPPHDVPGQTFALHVGQVSPKETKRIHMKMKAVRYSIGTVNGPDARVWVKDVPGVYTKASFGAKATNVDDRQTFNGGDLKAAASVDIYSRTRWSFDGGMLEGWSDGDGTSVSAENAARGLVVSCKGTSPQTLGPITTFEADTYPAVKIAFTNARIPVGAHARISFLTKDAKDFDSTRSVELDFPTGGPSVQIVDMRQNPLWKGTITRLRLEPGAGTDGDLAIDDLRMITAAEIPTPEEPAATDEAAGCGCRTARDASSRDSGASFVGLTWIAMWALRARRRTR